MDEGSGWFEPRTIASSLSGIMAAVALSWNIWSSGRNRKRDHWLDQFDEDIRSPLYEALDELGKSIDKIHAQARIASSIDLARSDIAKACQIARSTIRSSTDTEIAPNLNRISSLIRTASRTYSGVWGKISNEFSGKVYIDRHDNIYKPLSQLSTSLQKLEETAPGIIILDASREEVERLIGKLIAAFHDEDIYVRSLCNDLRSLLGLNRTAPHRMR